MNEFHQLIQEILNFSTAIDHSDTENADYQQACSLFYGYLEAQIDELNHSLSHKTSLNEEDRTTLNKLIMPEEYTNQPCSLWMNAIFNHCQQLEKNHRLTA